MPNRFIKISVITLNFNTAQNTIKLLDSLKVQTDQKFQTVVVDNHSESDDAQALRDYVAKTNMKLIENTDNLGFSGGNNRGVHYSFQSGADWVLLLNSDTIVKPDFIEILKTNLAGRTGLAGLPINEGDVTSCGGRMRWLSRPSKHNHIYGLGQHCDYIVGAAMLISREAFQKLGQLDENYFLYYEDADYSAIANRKHVPISCLTKPVVYHAISYTTRHLGPALLLHYQYRNVLYYNAKNGPWYVRMLVRPWCLQIKAKQRLKIMLNRNRPLSRAILAGVEDFCRGQMGRIEP